MRGMKLGHHLPRGTCSSHRSQLLYLGVASRIALWTPTIDSWPEPYAHGRWTLRRQCVWHSDCTGSTPDRKNNQAWGWAIYTFWPCWWMFWNTNMWDIDVLGKLYIVVRWVQVAITWKVTEVRRYTIHWRVRLSPPLPSKFPRAIIFNHIIIMLHFNGVIKFLVFLEESIKRFENTISYAGVIITICIWAKVTLCMCIIMGYSFPVLLDLKYVVVNEILQSFDWEIDS